MSVRSFHSVFMATAVAGAALGCYLVSLRVASERAALEQVEYQIVETQRDIRLLQTEIGTRGRLAQLERWNVRVLALSAPTADQILGDKFQLARLVRPERRAIDAPIYLASAPAPQPQQPLADEEPPVSSLLHQASLKLPDREEPAVKAVEAPPQKRIAKLELAGAAKVVAPKKTSAGPMKSKAKVEVASAAPLKAAATAKKAGDKPAKTAIGEVTRKTRTASVDPLAPLPGGGSSSKGPLTKK